MDDIGFQQKILNVILFMPGFLLSLSCHEAAHAFAAHKLGDDTAKRLGRMSLSPIPHIDIIGTLILPILGMFTGFVFGWGKPVPVDYRNLKNMKRDGMLIAAAGPAANLILAVVIAAVFRFIVATEDVVTAHLSPRHIELLVSTLSTYMILNLALGFFNLIPIQPLDGGKILYGILPLRLAIRIDEFTTRYGMLILLVLIFSGVFRYLLWPPIKVVYAFLLSGV